MAGFAHEGEREAKGADNFVDGKVMAITLHADEAEALRREAEDLTGAGEFDAALALLARAQKLNPLSVDVHFDRAVANHFKGNDAETLEILGATTRVLVIPDALMVLVHQLRGDALRDLGRLEEALAAYEASLAMGPSPRYLQHPLEQRALLLAQLGRADETPQGTGGLAPEEGEGGMAVDGGTTTVEVRVEEAEALRLEAVDCVTAGDNDVALELLAQAQRLDPLSVDVRFWRATALRFRGDHAEALAALDDLERTFVVPPNLLFAAALMRGDVHYGEGRMAEALADTHVASILELGPTRYPPDVVAEWGEPRHGSRYAQAGRRAAVRRAVRRRSSPGLLVCEPLRRRDRGGVRERRGGGAGRGRSALIASAEEALRGMGATEATIDASLNAEPFYARHGFRSLAEAEHRLSSGGTMRCVRMAKALKSGVGSWGAHNALALTIDSAQAEDAEAAWSFLQRFATSYEPSREAFDRNFPHLVEDENVDLLMARSGGEPVGYLLAHRLPTLFAGGPILSIAELFVDEGRRRRGIGSALVLAALNRAWAIGCVEAMVPTRRARGFYEALGFEASAGLLKRRSPSDER